MANDFNASLVINTAAATAGVRALDSASKDLDKTLQSLHKSLANGQKDLDAVAKSMKHMSDTNRAYIRTEQDRAKATVMAAKADGVAIDNSAKRGKIARENAIAEAKVAKLRQQTVTAGKSGEATTVRRDAEALNRITNANTLAQQKLTSEVTRTATAQQNYSAATTRAGSASEMAAARTQRLANSSRSAQSGTLALNDSLSNSRYLLYDVGQTYTVLALALQAIPIATAAVAIAYEKDFAQVARTNDTLAEGNGLAVLREDLKQLATQIPLTFDEFSKISTIGGQLGISGDDISAFTETVAKFGAASNVSLDQASTAFGRYQNSFDPKKLDPNFFNKVGSAVAFVGVKSAATETEIIAVSNQISAAGAQFGFAADEIVGLSGALASVRIRPELARGAFQRIMLGLSRSADEGAESFQKFGKYTGLAAEESLALFKTDPSEFFHKYVGGIKGAIAETGSVSAVLDDIGAKNVFDKQFLLGLANGYDVFTDALNNSSKAFTEGTFLDKSTEAVFETVDAKLKRITNSIKNLMDTVGKGSLSGLSGVADSVLGIVNSIDRLAQSSAGFTTFINVVLGLGSAIGILLAFKAAQAFMLAGLVGFQQVLGKGTLAAGLTAKGILQQVAVTMLMAKGVSQAHAQALVLQSNAFKVMGMSAATANAQVAGFAAGTVTRNVAATTGAMGGLTRGIKTAGGAMLGLVGGPIGAMIIAVGLLGLSWMEAKEQVAAAADEMVRAAQNGSEAGLEGAANALGNIKVKAADGVVALGNMDKKLVEIARDAGVPFEKLVAAAQKGADAGEEVNKVLDEVVKSRGFDSMKELTESLNPSDMALVVQLGFLRTKVTELGEQSVTTKKNVDEVAKAAGKAGDAAGAAAPEASEFADEIGAVGDESETASEKLDKFIDSVFGLVDVAGGTQSALQNLGESLANSSNFGPSTEGGRENVDNFREALKAAGREQQWLIENTGKSQQQASADYIAFVEGLTAEMVSRGVDPAIVTGLADQVKNHFGSALVAGPQPKVSVGAQVDQPQLYAAAVETQNLVQNWIDQFPNPKMGITADGRPAIAKINVLAQSIAEITGLPFEVVVDALTDPAHEKSREIEALLIAITTGTYVAPVDADTSAAVKKIQDFVQYARTELGRVHAAANGGVGYGDGEGSMSPEMKAEYGALNAPTPVPRTAPVRQAVPQIRLDPNPSSKQFDSLSNGYDKVRSAAEKAGKKGKEAGEDMADGISEATRAANDYANRLKTGLTSAFEQQYGVTKATDDYHSALNAINKKRDDELKQIEDLVEAQKELNDARKEELINARKAGIEKGISLKYGEVDRAADYAQQEEQALNAAAAKQKDIQANAAQINSLEAGIGKLDGYSQAAIDNREALRGLEQKMIDMVVAYANTGASVDQVRAYAANLTGQFRTDVLQMGFNQTAVGNLQGSLERYIGVINRVPLVKPTKVEADTDQALADLGAINDELYKMPPKRKIEIEVNEHYTKYIKSIHDRAAMEDLNGDASGGGRGGMYMGGQVKGYAGGGHIGGKSPSNPRVDNLMASVDGKGLVGVRSGEFIVQEPAVKYWGLDFMNNINNRMPMFNGGGSVGGGASGGGGGSMVVALDAETLAFLASLQQDIKLYADSKELAAAVNKGNRILVAEGMNK